MIVFWDADPNAVERFRFALGADVLPVESAPLVERALEGDPSTTQVVIGPDVDLAQACILADGIRVDRHEVGVLLLRHRLEITVLSQALRSGIREVVSTEDHAAITEALRRSRELTAKLAGHSGGGALQGRDGRVITVFSAKGGVGKTTLATNIAAHLANSGLRTLLIDLDLAFGDCAISLQLLPTRSVYDAVAMTGHIDQQGIASLTSRHEASGLDVICAPGDPADADRLPVSTVVELLRVSRGMYDYVIVDTPPSFTEHVLAASDLSSLLVLVATLDIPSIKNLKVAFDTLDVLGNPRESRIVVLNRADARSGLKAEDVVAALKEPITSSIPSSPSVPAAINRGVAIVLDEPRHPVSVALRDLVDLHVRARFEDGVPQTGRTRRGLFGKGRS